MSERRVIRECVYPTDAERYGDGPPDNLLAFRDWLTEKIESVPELYRARAKVSMAVQNDRWGDDDCSCSLEFSISYERPETDGEGAAREREDRDRIERKRVYKGLIALGVDHSTALARAEGRCV